MKKTFLLTIACLMVLFSQSCKNDVPSKRNPKTILTGTIIDRDSSKALFLIEKLGDYRIDYQEIPIVDGKFNYTLNDEVVQQYQLAFKEEIERGSWMGIDFFNDADTVRFQLYPSDNYVKNNILGGKENTLADSLRKTTNKLFWNEMLKIEEEKLDSLIKIKKWNTEEVNALWDQYDKETDSEKKDQLVQKFRKLRDQNKHLTPEALFWEMYLDSINTERKTWEINWLKDQNNLLGYSMLIDKISFARERGASTISELRSIFSQYKTAFPNHPYTVAVNDMLYGVENIKEGGFYADFTAKTKTDALVKVSSSIPKNKVTLIDLWAPWCGSCIAKDKKLAPKYERLNKKGLEVFAVLGAIKEKEEYIKTEEQYKYPWKLNYELNQEFGIWGKYNISNSGGSQFLVNTQGTILAINPSVQEIDSILNILQP